MRDCGKGHAYGYGVTISMAYDLDQRCSSFRPHNPEDLDNVHNNHLFDKDSWAWQNIFGMKFSWRHVAFIIEEEPAVISADRLLVF